MGYRSDYKSDSRIKAKPSHSFTTNQPAGHVHGFRHRVPLCSSQKPPFIKPMVARLMVEYHHAMPYLVRRVRLRFDIPSARVQGLAKIGTKEELVVYGIHRPFLAEYDASGYEGLRRRLGLSCRSGRHIVSVSAHFNTGAWPFRRYCQMLNGICCSQTRE